MRPRIELRTTTSFSASAWCPSAATSRVGSSTTRYSPAKTRPRAVSSSSGPVEARKPTRPKFTPSTGTPVSRSPWSARSIVPSPPSTTRMSTERRSSAAGLTPCFSASSSPKRSSTPEAPATLRSRSSAGPIVCGFPWVTTAARRTALDDRGPDPLVEVGWELWMLTLDEVEEHLPVPFRAGQPRVYDPDGLASPRERRLGHLAHDAAPHHRIAHHALRRLAAGGLELRLDEHERLPARRGERERRRQRLADADERHVARDELRRERELLERPGVHALDHRHARVGAKPLVELAVADVERDHARRPPLQEDVGEPARRGADVEAVETGDIDPERVERVTQLLATARDELRRRGDGELSVLLDLHAGLRVPGHAAGEDERLRLSSRLRQAALDEEDVEALLHLLERRITREPAPSSSPSQLPQEPSTSRPARSSIATSSAGVYPRSECRSSEREPSGRTNVQVASCRPVSWS